MRLLDQIVARRDGHDGFDVRIIVSPKFLFGKEKQAFLETMSAHGFELEEHYRFLSANHFVHCHNKLIIVDNDKILLGSQNWSTAGLLTNREASLLVEDSAIVDYFAEIFEADWHMSESSSTIMTIDASVARPPAGSQFVVSTSADYADI